MNRRIDIRRNFPLHLMLLPGVALVIVYSYWPMAGLMLAFQKFNIASFSHGGYFASPFVGFDNFKYVFGMPEFPRVLWNTIFIASMKIVAGTIVPILFALLLNEVAKIWLKRVVQTVTYLPYFLSWVILGGIISDILASDGLVNQFLIWLHLEPVFFMGDNRIFPYMLVATDLWKSTGFNTIIYLAALTAINPSLYEAAVIDGANRWKQTLHVTLPGMMPIIVLLGTLSLGDILNAGFEQIFVLYNPVVFQSGDIIDTFNYRIGLLGAKYDIGTAIGLFKSCVSLVMVSVSYALASKFANYRIF
ncbi:ABC transporter permease [Cohnella sp. GCM10020058]|uniref:ABC transporter permease n=1 Tax=Cohnella sp. GCM10020058 TaxID=3317330 RepID=UPI00363F5948